VIDGGTPGATGTASFSFTVEGTLYALSSPAASGAYWTFVAEYDPDDWVNGTQTLVNEIEEIACNDAGKPQFCGGKNVLSTFTGIYDFEYGTPFIVEGELYVNTWIQGDATGSAYADFDSTVALTAYTVPSGATLTASSGTTYPLTVPEPGPTLSCAAAVAALLACQCLRRGRFPLARGSAL